MNLITIIILLIITSITPAKSNDQNCQGGDSAKWHNCRGAVVIDLSTYVGEFKKGMPSGYGTFTYSDGSVYVGDFEKGKEHGQGVFNCWAHGSKYVGQFKNGKKHGKGIYTYPDGAIYNGEWIEGKREGEGIMIFKDGKRLVGKFKNDKYQ